MDPFTHTVVGLTAAKAGLGRLSPLATTVCVMSASSPDCDVIVGIVSDRWNYLHHHRGITHSILGVLALSVVLPSIVYGLARLIAAIRRRKPRVQYRGLVLASLIVTATHPLLDWTNNYGLRPLLPWSGRWFYGDLAFVVDPFILLVVGGAAFLATSDRWPKIVLWSVLAAAIVGLSFVVRSRPHPDQLSVNAVRAILLSGIAVLIVVRIFLSSRAREKGIAMIALASVVFYLGGLAFLQRAAYRQAEGVSESIASNKNERFSRVAAMPMLASPFTWTCVAETDKAIYRFIVRVGGASSVNPQTIVDGYQARDSPGAVERYEKPQARAAELVTMASQDRRAQILIGFARFPIGRVEDENCIDRTLVQFADLRYTEPGASRGTFSVNVPVECPPH
jgi:inner membrane protein